VLQAETSQLLIVSPEDIIAFRCHFEIIQCDSNPSSRAIPSKVEGSRGKRQGYATGLRAWPRRATAGLRCSFEFASLRSK
jgi:hypothetical protein